LGSAGFRNHNLGEERELWLEPIPDPDGDVFAGGVLQARDIVQVVVIQFFPQRPECLRDVRVIHDPSKLRIAWTLHNYFDLEAVSVEPPAFVRFGQERQQMGCLKLERFS